MASFRACAVERWLIAALAVLFLPLEGKAQATYTWSGASSSNWENPLNWMPAGVPGAADHVVIAAAPNSPVLPGARAVASCTVGSGTLDLGGFSLSVSGAGAYTGGTIANGTLVLSGPAGPQLFAGTLMAAAVSGSAASIVFGGSVFQQPVALTRTGAVADLCYGANIFQQPVSLTQSGTGSWSIAHTGSAQFLGGVAVACTTGGIVQFGASGGATLIAAGQVLSIGAAGFSSGQLTLRNVTFAGANPQSITLTGTAMAVLQAGCLYNGDLSLAAPRLQVNGGTFNGAASFTKTGAGADLCAGGCTFNGPVEYHLAGAGNLYPANTGADLYNAGFTVASTGAGGLLFGWSGGTSTIAVGHGIAVGAPGFGTGLLHLSRITQLGGAPVALPLGPAAVCRIAGPNTFNGPFTAAAGTVLVSGSTFNAPCALTKTGAGDDASAGGNVFNGALTLGLTGPGAFKLHATGVDQFNGDLSFTSTGTGSIQLGAVSGSSSLAAGHAMGIAPGTFTSGTLVLRNLLQLGPATHALHLTGTAGIQFGAGCTFNGPIAVTAPSVLFNGSTFNSTLSATKTGGGVDGCQGGNTFNALSEFTVTGPGAIWLNQVGVDQFNGDIRVNSVGGGGIFFGHSGGSALLAAGRTIAVGALGYNAGVLSFRNFQQIGPTAQSLLLTGSGGLRFNVGTAFGGSLTAQSATLLLDGATFFGDFDGTRANIVVDACRGGNVFHGSFKLRQLGSGDYVMATQAPDQFLGPAWFQRLGTGGLYVAYTHDARFGSDLSLLGSTGPVVFGGDGGWVEVIGAGTRDWLSTASLPFQMPRLRVNAPGGLARLHADVLVAQSIAFAQGVLQPMAPNSSAMGLLILQHGAAVTDPADDGSYADGWVRKVGSSAFTFPLGHGGAHAPLAISAPLSPAHHFTARYRRLDPDPLWSTALKDPTLDHLSRCEYWELERTAGASAVVVTLSWGTPRSCGVDFLPDLRLARWDGGLWRDQGNGGTTGTTSAGTVASASATAQFGPFTLASATLLNPLPVELLTFDAEDAGDRVRARWSTASEQGSEAFELERSGDGERFVGVARVAAAGSSQAIIRYEAFDAQPLPGLSYYRLRMIDADGSFRLGPAVAVQRDPPAVLSAYPNPAEERLWLDWPAQGDERAEVYDMTGGAVGTLHAAAAQGRLVLDVSGLAAGVYLLRLWSHARAPAAVRFMKR